MQITSDGATGVTIEHGLSNTTYFEAEVRRVVAANCQRIVLMADHTKFGRDALISYCPLERVNTVVTDRPLAPQYMDFCQDHHIQVLC